MFAGTGAIIVDGLSDGAVSHIGIGLTFGLVVMTVIYAVGDISGAHINPAVTLGFWIARRFSGQFVLPYVLSQSLGALAASFVLSLLFLDHTTLGETVPSGTAFQSFVLELLLMSFLMFVILSVSTGAKEKGMMAGVAIGAVVGLEALFAGPISGASMNPARSLGPAVISGHLKHLWIYMLAPSIGAFLGVVGCRCVQSSVCCGAIRSDEGKYI